MSKNEIIATRKQNRSSGKIVRGSSLDDLFSERRGGEQIVFLDRSSSMLERIGDTQNTKWDHLVMAVDKTYESLPETPCICFDSSAQVVPINDLGRPRGSTNLKRALQLGLETYKPEDLESGVVISDGMVDGYKDGIIELAMTYEIPFNTIFIGMYEDYGAKFLRELAELTGGTSQTINDKTEAEIRQLAPVLAGFLGSGKKTINL